jgi:hypothetical protein
MDRHGDLAWFRRMRELLVAALLTRWLPTVIGQPPQEMAHLIASNYKPNRLGLQMDSHETTQQENHEC